MFSCLWQLWDWIDPPTFTTMESKKLQQLQQANSHLAPMPQMKPPQGGGYQQGGYDYGATGTALPPPGRSALFPPSAQYQNYGQPHPSASLRSPYSTGSPKSSLSTNSGALYGATGDGGDQSSTSGGQSYHHHHAGAGPQQLLHAHQQQQQQQYRSNTLGPGGSYGYDQQQQQMYRVSSPSSGSGGASERERLYQTAPLVRSGAGGPGSGVGTPHSVTSGISSNAPMSKLELQFQQLQREKIQQQIKTATEAIAHQQQTFALRQQLNPPVPNYHLKQNLLQNLSQHHQQQIQQQQQQHQQQQPQPQHQLQVHKHPQYPPQGPQQQQQQQKQLVQQQKQQQQMQKQQQMQQAMKQQQQQQQRYAPNGSQNRNAPPSSLNLLNHCQPAANETDKIMRSHVPSYQGTGDTAAGGGAGGAYGEEESLYLQRSGYQQGVTTSPPGGGNSEIIIQQNIPGQVVNQACQTQISSMVLAGNSNAVQQQQQQQQMKSSPSDTLSSPSHDSSERKRGSGGGQQHTLKSPVTKRPANAPVALSGWLYKQGSDGLKVWRRRWFVLSEYVLYYYKGQEEEKLLGTVLLPSYKVSACFPEDKIYRKFAFKCEHANMRTFVFAAENGESMSQWVRALTLATMMIQPAGSEQEELQHNGGKSGGNGMELLSSDSSGGGQQSQGSNDTMKLIQQAGGNGSSGSSSGGGVPSALNDSLPQPLYANAPPKPRRVNDAGYSSPSPEHTMLHDRYNDQMVQQQQQPQHQPMLSSSGLFPGAAAGPQSAGGMVLGSSRTPSALTAHAIYGDPKRIERDLYIQKLIEQQQQQQKLNASKQQQQQQQQGMQSSPMHGQTLRGTPGAGTNPFLYPSNDRRTPDTYGPPNSAIDPKHMSDYEDIYNLTMLSKSLPSNTIEGMGGGGAPGGTSYKRPTSPLRYKSNGAFPAYMGNAMYNAGQFEHQPAPGAAPLPQHIQMRARPISPSIPRPHSADFLDYEARHPISQAVGGVNDEPSPVHRTPRPKSSLDINRTPDHYYYSEASYAEKMRLQSASYLQRANNSGTGASRKQRSDDTQGLFASGTMPRDGLYRSGSGKIMQQQQPGQQAEDYPLGSQSMPRPSATERSVASGGQGRPSVSSLKKQGNAQQQEQFARSASARLPRKEEDTTQRDGERKREESMKRLLEWKQRMLQSPLTKKSASQHTATMASAESLNRSSNVSASGAGGDRRNEDIYGMKADDSLLRSDYYASSYERQSVGDLTALGSAARKHGGSAVNIAQASSTYGSEMKLNGDYNSYSSDDEDGRNFAPAGRSSPLVSTASTAKEVAEAPPPPTPPPPPPPLLPPPSQSPHNLTQHTHNSYPPFTEFVPSAGGGEGGGGGAGAQGSTTDNNTMHALTQTFYADGTIGSGGGGGGVGGDGSDRIIRKDASDGTMVEQAKPAGLGMIKQREDLEEEEEEDDEEEDDGLYEDSLVNHASVSASPNLSVDANVYENSFLKPPNVRKGLESDLEKRKEMDDREGIANGHDYRTDQSSTSVLNGSGMNNTSVEDKTKLIIEKGSTNQYEAQSYVPVYKHSMTSLNTKSLHSPPSSDVASGIYNKLPKEVPSDEPSNTQTDENFSDPGVEKGEKDDGEDIFEYTDEDLDEALQQAEQHAELTPKDKPKSDERLRALDDELSLQILEGHYMPMTPRRTLISSASSCTTLSLMNQNTSQSTTQLAPSARGKLRPCESLTAMDILDSIQKSNEMQMCNTYDESTYIEMTKGTHGKSVFATTAEELRGGTTYEMIMVPESQRMSSANRAGEQGFNKRQTGDSEPLYMELSQLHSSINALSSKDPVHGLDGAGKGSEKESGKGTDGQQKPGTESANDFVAEKTSTMVRMKNAMTGGGSGGKKKKKDKNWPDIVMQSSRTDDSDSESDCAEKLTDDCKRIKKKERSGKEKKLTSDVQCKSVTARSRFSLSDTFRPASYYLGASGSTPFGNGAAGESTFDILLDSSDSDIVSPPPIPITSLPLDEPDGTGAGGDDVEDDGRMLLGVGMVADMARYTRGREKFRSSEAIDLIKTAHAQQEKRQSVQSLIAATSSGGQSLAGSMNLSYGMRRESGSISSNRSSLLSSSQGLFNNGGAVGKVTRDQYDGVSHGSSEYESGANGGQAVMGGSRDNTVSARSSITLSETSGSIDWRSRSCMDVSVRNKRRPISGSSVNCPIELALDGCEIASAEVDRYSLHSVREGTLDAGALSTDLSNFSQNGHDNSIYYENVDIAGPPAHGSSESIARSSQSVPILSPLREKNLSLHDARCQSEYLGTVLEGHSLDLENASLSSAMDPDQQSSCTLRCDYDRATQCNRTITPIDAGGAASVVAEPLHSRNNSTLSSEGAPYYYSDLQARSREEDGGVLHQHSRQVSSERAAGGGADTLNNQRDPGGLRKPTTGSIFHIHNPLNTLKAANLLLHASANEKHAEIDRKNIYESDRMGQKDVNKTIAASLAAGGTRATLLMAGGRSASSLSMGTSKDGSAVNVRQSTGSLGAPSSQGAFPMGNSEPIAGCSSHSRRGDTLQQVVDNSAAGNISSGDQHWEEDTLWRDNLRRVSHIHAKSMDNLDHLGTIRSPSAALLVKTINQQQEQREMQDRLRDGHQHAPSSDETSPTRPIVKINRKDVTYVNEHLTQLPVAKAGFGEQSQAPPIPKSILRTPTADTAAAAGCNGDDDDVYVQLASNVSSTGTIVRDGRWSSSSGRESDAVYEVLRDEKNRYDINRETIRQWDLMSSGLVNSSNMAGSSSRPSGSNSGFAGSGKSNVLPAMDSSGETFSSSTAGTRSLLAKQYFLDTGDKTNDTAASVNSLNSGKRNIENSQRRVDSLRDKYSLEGSKGPFNGEDNLNGRKIQ